MNSGLAMLAKNKQKVTPRSAMHFSGSLLVSKENIPRAFAISCKKRNHCTKAVQWFLLLLYQTVRAGSDELQNCHLSCIAAASADLDDAGVAAVAVSVLGADLVKQLLCNIFLGDVGVDLTLGVHLTSISSVGL